MHFHTDMYSYVYVQIQDQGLHVLVLLEICFVGEVGSNSLLCFTDLYPTHIFILGEEYSLWRKLHNEELRDMYSSPSIIRIVKSRRMRWAGQVARMREKRNAYRLLV
jgi:hypothetical protein